MDHLKFVPNEDGGDMAWSAAFYAFFASPLALWLINRFLLQNKIHWLLLWAIAAFTCYFCLVLSVHLLDSQLLAELHKHDLDGNGSFSESEDSPAMRKAMARVTNDTGRTLAPFTGIPFSIVWVSLNHIPLGFISLAIWQLRSFRGEFDAVETDDFQQIVESQSVDGTTSNNPYHPPASIIRERTI